MEQLASKLADVRYRQGRLLSQIESLGFELQRGTNLNILTDDVVKSSAIEGDVLNPEEVRSSVARRLGIHDAKFVPTNRHVEGIVDMMLDATQMFTAPLTTDRLFGWHAALFPTGRSGLQRITVGSWRTSDIGPMKVVSGPIGRETVHFEAPDAIHIAHEMSVFLAWFNQQKSVDPVLKSGIAHFWFVTIHPFEDGNGRIARAIGDMALTQADGTPQRFYSLSSQIERERKDYYNQLEKQQRSTPEITVWLGWFLDCLGRAISSAEKELNGVLLRDKLWGWINRSAINERQRHIIQCMLSGDFKGRMNTSKYAKLAACSNDTALRDIQDLKEHGIFIQNPGGGRSTSYRLASAAESLRHE